jgi:hypothetical protein
VAEELQTAEKGSLPRNLIHAQNLEKYSKIVTASTSEIEADLIVQCRPLRDASHGSGQGV